MLVQAGLFHGPVKLDHRGQNPGQPAGVPARHGKPERHLFKFRLRFHQDDVRNPLPPHSIQKWQSVMSQSSVNNATSNFYSSSKFPSLIFFNALSRLCPSQYSTISLSSCPVSISQNQPTNPTNQTSFGYVFYRQNPAAISTRGRQYRFSFSPSEKQSKLSGVVKHSAPCNVCGKPGTGDGHPICRSSFYQPIQRSEKPRKANCLYRRPGAFLLSRGCALFLRR